MWIFVKPRKSFIRSYSKSSNKVTSREVGTGEWRLSILLILLNSLNALEPQFSNFSMDQNLLETLVKL